MPSCPIVKSLALLSKLARARRRLRTLRGSSPPRPSLVTLPAFRRAVLPCLHTSEDAISGHLLCARGNWSPSSRAQLDIGIVPLWIVAGVPVLWWRRGRDRRRQLDIDRRCGLDHRLRIG